MNNIFKALGDENRLRILNLLRKGELCVCEIEVILETTQSNISRHLGKLKNENIITFKKRAQWMHYYINPKFIEENELLYKYINERMNQDPKFLRDLERLTTYKESECSCENIKEMGGFIFS